jgi:hypothetical protein
MTKQTTRWVKEFLEHDTSDGNGDGGDDDGSSDSQSTEQQVALAKLPLKFFLT